MEQKETTTKATASSFPRLFNQAAKYIRFERYNGIDLRKQSKHNYQALLKRLDDRTNVPEAERQNYGSKRFSADEAPFLRLWHQQIIPLFTGGHGTNQYAYIHHAGCMTPVADRRRSDDVHQNSRTGGVDRQDYNYFVLGIGRKHPVPQSVQNGKIILLHFGKMTAEERQQYAGMFIGGHDADYQRDVTYPIVVCGTTEFKVNYNKKSRLRTTTFKREDGTLITEILSPAEELIAADPSIDVIFGWLGYKMVEYLRFIGGDFQKEILSCNDVDKIAHVFHTLFPSYRFPELKIPLKKIPITAPYVEVMDSTEVSYKAVSDFHRACAKSDLHTVQAMINPTIVSAPGKDEKTPLTIVMENSYPISLDLVELLLDNNVDPNAGRYFDSNLSRALKTGHPELISVLMRGSSHPHCRSLRLLPQVAYVELKAVIESHRYDLFDQFYPHYLQYRRPQDLLEIASRCTEESCKEYPKNPQLSEDSRRSYQQSLQILERILPDCDPNCEDDAEKAFCQAAKNGKLRVVIAFLKHPKLKINQTTTSNGQRISDYHGWTALHYACWKGQVEVVKALLNAGIDVNAKTRSGMTALAIAENVLNGSLDFMSEQERKSEQMTNFNLSQMLNKDLGKEGLSSEKKKNLEAIIVDLKAKGATRDIVAETEEKPSTTHFAVVACIRATYKSKQYVVLVRKKNHFDEAKGMFLFPGGFYDPQRDQGDFSAGAVREVMEETGIDLTAVNCTNLATFKTQTFNTEVERQFFLFDIGTVERLPFCVAKSDVGQAQWVDVEQIKCTLLNGELAMSFRNISVCHSNAVILSALQRQLLPEEQAIISSQKLTTEYTPADVGSALFLVFHLQSAYSVREALIPTFMELKPKVPKGYLQDCFDEIIAILREDQGEEKAKTCVQNLIMHLVKTGLCNIDDLRQKGVPLFHLCCMFRKMSSIIWLAEQGADVNAMFAQGLTNVFPLAALIMANDCETARILIDRFGASTTLGATTDSALTVACSQKSIPDDFIEYLFEKSGVITDELLGTVVHELIRTRRFALLDKVLTQFPINLNHEYLRRQDLPGAAYPILTAINCYQMEGITILAKHGADLTLQHTPNSNLIQFATFLERSLNSNREQFIARLPDHPEYQKDPKYFRAIHSDFFPERNLDKEQLELRLRQTEQDIEEINKIIAHLESFLSPKPPQPQHFEEFLEQRLEELLGQSRRDLK